MIIEIEPASLLTVVGIAAAVGVAIQLLKPFLEMKVSDKWFGTALNLIAYALSVLFGLIGLFITGSFSVEAAAFLLVQSLFSAGLAVYGYEFITNLLGGIRPKPADAVADFTE